MYNLTNYTTAPPGILTVVKDRLTVDPTHTALSALIVMVGGAASDHFHAYVHRRGTRDHNHAQKRIT